jgi:hypothetical protein
MVLRRSQLQRRGPARCTLLTRRDLLSPTVPCEPPQRLALLYQLRYRPPRFTIQIRIGQDRRQTPQCCPTRKGGCDVLSLQ